MSLRARSLPLLVLLGLTLAGCTSAPQPTPEPTVPPTAQQTPPPTEPGEASGIDCTSVLSPDGYAKLTADGLEPIDPKVIDPLAVEMTDAGGTACSWGKPQTDITLTVVQVLVPDQDLRAWEATLADTGYVPQDGPGAGVYTGSIDNGTGIPPIAVVSGDRITFVSSPAFEGYLAAHAI
jgi:hypothetical protein